MKAAVYHGPYDIRSRRCRTPSSRPASSCSRSMPPESAAPTSASTSTGRSHATNGHDVTGHHGPPIPGHEFSGRVVEVAPDVEGFELGMVVASGAGISCASAGAGAWPDARISASATRPSASSATERSPSTVPSRRRRVSPSRASGSTRRPPPSRSPCRSACTPSGAGAFALAKTSLSSGLGGIGAFLTYAAAASGAVGHGRRPGARTARARLRARRANTAGASKEQTLAGRRRRAPPRACGRLRGDGQRDGLPAGLRRRSSRRTPSSSSGSRTSRGSSTCAA